MDFKSKFLKALKELKCSGLIGSQWQLVASHQKDYPEKLGSQSADIEKLIQGFLHGFDLKIKLYVLAIHHEDISPISLQLQRKTKSKQFHENSFIKLVPVAPDWVFVAVFSNGLWGGHERGFCQLLIQL